MEDVFGFSTFSADSEQKAKKEEVQLADVKLEISKSFSIFCISFLWELCLVWEETLVFCSSEKD